MIRNIIFDLGNVLLDFSPQEYLRTKINDESKVQQVYEEIFLSKEWPMLDRGTISEAEAVKNMMARSLENSQLIAHCMKGWYELLTPMAESVAVLQELKNKGYKLFVLSNFHALAYENVSKRCGFFQYFDGELISYREKLLKPEAEIYNLLATRYQFEPSESIFIDDTKVNVEGASSIGFQTILFKNAMELRKELIALGIL